MLISETKGIDKSTAAFLTGLCCTLKATADGMQYVANEPPITLLTTSAILFPLAALIGIATQKIFDDLGWHPSDARFIVIGLFTMFSSTTLAAAAAVGFGVTPSLYTAWTASMVGFELLCAGWHVGFDLRYIYFKAQDKSFRYIMP